MMDGLTLRSPIDAEERREQLAEALVAQQQAGIDRFSGAVRTFIAEVKACDWPLGCPVDGYDKEAIIAIAEVDWTDLNPPDAALADEIAEGM